jgi:phosphoribosylanthranilate isomerase
MKTLILAVKRLRGRLITFCLIPKPRAHGGSGKIFNWDVLNEYNWMCPFFLSGGISLDNLAEDKKH